jgi:hypothetical protein
LEALISLLPFSSGKEQTESNRSARTWLHIDFQKALADWLARSRKLCRDFQGGFDQLTA